MADAIPSVVRYAKLDAELGEKRALMATLEETLSELEFHGRETGAERALLERLRKLLAEAEKHIASLRQAPGESEATALVFQLEAIVEDVDWDVAESMKGLLTAEAEQRKTGLQQLIERTVEYERLFAQVLAELDLANRQGVRLPGEAKYVSTVMEHLKRVKLAAASKVYRDVPKLLTIAEKVINDAAARLGAPLARNEDLDASLSKVRENVRNARPFAAHADLLLLQSRTPESVDYTVLLRTPSRPGTQGVNIQGSSTLSEEDHSEFGMKVDSIGDAIRSGRVRSVSTLPFDAQAGSSTFSAEDQIKGLGEQMFRLVMPEDMQRYVSENPSSVTITTNDLELPWELMTVAGKTLCLEQPVARMPMGYAVPRRTEQRPNVREQKRFLLMWSDPEGNLPNVRLEIQEIKTALSSEAGTEITVVEAVTGKQLKEILLSGDQFDVLHYAGHAKFDKVRPEQSSLALHLNNPNAKAEPKAHFGRFFSQTVRRLLNGQPLVFLNACETGAAAPEEAKEFALRTPAEGLASAFVYGGALGCVGTFWPVQDDFAAKFAIYFYRLLLQGEMLGEAIRQSRLFLRKQFPQSSSWATFVLYGDPTFRL